MIEPRDRTWVPQFGNLHGQSLRRLLKVVLTGVSGFVLFLSVQGCHLILPLSPASTPSNSPYICSAQIYRTLPLGSQEFSEEWRAPVYTISTLALAECSNKLNEYINTSLAPDFTWGFRNFTVTPLSAASGSNCSSAGVAPLLFGAPLGAELTWQNPPASQAYTYVQLVDKNQVTATAEPSVAKASIALAEKTGLPDWSAGGAYVRGKQHARVLDFFLELATPFALGSGKTVTKLRLKSSGTIIAEKDGPGTLYKIYSGRATLFFYAEGTVDGNSGTTSFCHKNEAVGSFTLYQGPPYAFFTLQLNLTPDIIGQNMLVKISLSKPTAAPSSFSKHQPFVVLANKTAKGPLARLAPDILLDHDNDLNRILWFEKFEAADEKFLGTGNPLKVLFRPGAHEITAVAYDNRGTYNSAAMALAVPEQPYRLGSEMKISPPADPDGDRYLPAIAYNAVHDEYLVVWHNRWAAGNRDIYARRISATGVLQPWFPVSTGSGDRVQPAVAFNAADQQYLVVWMYDVSGNGTQYEIWGRLIPWNGQNPGPAFRIFTWTNRSFYTPRVAWNSLRNQFLVVWNALDTTTGLFHDVAGIRIANGAVLPGGATLIATQNTPHQADVAYNLAADEYLAVWRAQYSGGDWDIRGIRLNGATLAPIGGYLYVGGSHQDEQSPSIASNQQGSYLAAWRQTKPGPCCDWDILAQELNNTGEKVGNPLVLANSEEDEANPRAAARPGKEKNFMVVWQHPSAAGVSVFGSQWGDENAGGVHQAPIADYAFWNAEKPVAAAGRAGYYVAYEGISAGDPNAHRAIYGICWEAISSLYLPLMLK